MRNKICDCWKAGAKSFMEKNEQKGFLKKFPLPAGWKLKIIENRGVFLFTQEGLAFGLDFSNKRRLVSKQPLVKAIGFRAKPLYVLDVTAGWMQESFLISQLGCYVTAVESNPFIFYFVQESLNQKKLKLSNLRFILDDSLNYMDAIKETELPDVIYMDPMFGAKKKSLSNKPLRILKQLVGETQDKQALFELALKKAKKRVVVKRHRLESPFKRNRLCFFKSRSICYDVFMPKRG